MSREKLEQHILQSYFFLRIGMAIIGLAFPLILLIIGLVNDDAIQPSISHYYHTLGRDIFVGALCAVASFLILYQGYSDRENIVLNLAGIFAAGVALFPTQILDTSPLQCEHLVIPKVHGVSAILFFLAIAYACIFLSSETLEEAEISEDKKNIYTIIYRVLGVFMILLPILATLFLVALRLANYITFAIEYAAIAVFSTYWIVKTVEFKETDIEPGPPSSSSINLQT